MIAAGDRLDAMAITNRTVKLMRDWVDGPLSAEYSMGADWDNRWRTGGSVDEVMDEAHLTTPYILEGIERFVRDREARLSRLHAMVDAADRRPETDSETTHPGRPFGADRAGRQMSARRSVCGPYFIAVHFPAAFSVKLTSSP